MTVFNIRRETNYKIPENSDTASVQCCHLLSLQSLFMTLIKVSSEKQRRKDDKAQNVSSDGCILSVQSALNTLPVKFSGYSSIT